MDTQDVSLVDYLIIACNLQITFCLSLSTSISPCLSLRASLPYSAMRGIAVGFLCLLGTGTARELQASRITQYLAGTADPSEDTVTDNFVRFQTVAVNRNLRGLFPVTESEDESVGDIRVGAEGPASREASPLAADLQMVGFGGQTAYV